SRSPRMRSTSRVSTPFGPNSTNVRKPAAYISSEFGPWATVYWRFRVWRNAGVFSALLEGMIAEAARRGQTDLSLVSVDSTTARAHYDAAGAHIGKDVMEALEEAAAEQEQARQKGVARQNRTDRTAGTPPSRKSDGLSGDGASSA
ncbi:hypothetical protein ABZV46_46175, partial [Streptomyces sp. NPDC005209]